MLTQVTTVTMYVAMPEDMLDWPEQVLFLGTIPGHVQIGMLTWTERKR